MKTFNLSGSTRNDFGKSASKNLRKEGLIPAIVYGDKEMENINFVVKEGDLQKLIFTPNVYIVNLNLDGKEIQSIVKDVQFHPVKDNILHIDFLHVSETKPVTIEIPVRLEGLAAGVKTGGKLSLDLRKLKVKALVEKLPEELVINVENLELGKSIQAGELNFEGLEILNAKNSVVCRVQLTRAARGLAAKNTQ